MSHMRYFSPTSKQQQNKSATKMYRQKSVMPDFSLRATSLSHVHWISVATCIHFFSSHN